MTDQEYLSWVEKRIRGAFMPGFAGTDAAFFNRELFDYVLDQAGEDVEMLNRHMRNFNAAHNGVGRSAKLRVDNIQRAIKLKIYTPSIGRKLTITRGGIQARPMALSE